MPDFKVRICSVELRNFKNVEAGKIDMPSAASKDFFTDRADILGLYGQNGSGKTAIIEALGFVQTLLTGASLPPQVEQYIRQGSPCCDITIGFSVEIEDRRFFADYHVVIALEETGPVVCKEVLSACTPREGRRSPRVPLISYDSWVHEPLFTPKYRCEEITRNEDWKIGLSVARRISARDRCSFIFGSEGLAVFLSAGMPRGEDYALLINALHQYAHIGLFVIANVHSGIISTNTLLPLAFRLDDERGIRKGDIVVRLDQPTLLPREEFAIVSIVIKEMNVVLCKLIPGLSIGMRSYGEQLLENGATGHRFELTSSRGSTVIPLRYESDGVIKLISVLNVLMFIYNDPSTCLVVDELDSGVFEYLLGELLAVLERGAKGQLIFTSHNLRVLEMIDKKSILFSTTNPARRYIRMQNVKSNNNLRDMYLRSILLGGQAEELYAETDTVEIARAFRRAGKAGSDGC